MDKQGARRPPGRRLDHLHRAAGGSETVVWHDSLGRLDERRHEAPRRRRPQRVSRHDVTWEDAQTALGRPARPWDRPLPRPMGRTHGRGGSR